MKAKVSDLPIGAPGEQPDHAARYIAIGREISCHTTTIATAIKIVSDTINVAFAISRLHIPLPPFWPAPAHTSSLPYPNTHIGPAKDLKFSAKRARSARAVSYFSPSVSQMTLNAGVAIICCSVCSTSSA
jgi:hypothetical protein